VTLYAVAAIAVAMAAAAQTVPPLPEQALAAVERSPRHGEWVGVEHAGGAPTKIWVMYPERRTKAPVIIVLHRTGELEDWTRAVADQLAADGYIAIAPELAPAAGAELRARLDGVRAYGVAIPAADGRTAVVVLDDPSRVWPGELGPAGTAVFRVDLAGDRGRAAQRAWPRVLDFLTHNLR
jgi:hypothetical protein